MPKPQSGADIKLVNAGIKLAKEKGLTGFTVRELCSKAKVNSGLFHYYFASRENFNRTVLRELYGTLLKDLSINIAPDIAPKDKLITFRTLVTKFIKNNSSLLSSIIIDILSGDKEIFAFIKENFTSHLRLGVSIVDECKKCGIVEDADSLNILFSFALPVIIPDIVAAILPKVLDKKIIEELKPLREKILSERSIEERNRLSLKAVLK